MTCQPHSTLTTAGGVNLPEFLEAIRGRARDTHRVDELYWDAAEAVAGLFRA